jgi:hypothetical protein
MDPGTGSLLIGLIDCLVTAAVVSESRPEQRVDRETITWPPVQLVVHQCDSLSTTTANAKRQLAGVTFFCFRNLCSPKK